MLASYLLVIFLCITIIGWLAAFYWVVQIALQSTYSVAQLYVCFVSLEAVKSSLLTLLVRCCLLDMMLGHRFVAPCVDCALAWPGWVLRVVFVVYFAHEILVRVGRQSSEEVVISPWPVLRGPCQLLCAMRRHRCEVPWVGYALAWPGWVMWWLLSWLRSTVFTALCLFLVSGSG